MAFDVRFYTFQKRINSTKTVTSTAALTVSCVLKENTDIINPTLVIKNKDNFNPWNYNYCWVSKFNRYYFVNTWRYVVGEWECECAIDVLATFRPVLELKTKYVLRSSYKYNKNIVDTFYPSLAWQPNYYTNTASFNFGTSILDGSFVIGIVNRHTSNFGAVAYYRMTPSNVENLIKEMLPTPSETWTSGFSGLTNTLYRSIYGPFDYIKTCKWFPFVVSGVDAEDTLYFGNYQCQNVRGNPIMEQTLFWFDIERNVYLPSSWLSLDAKYRAIPYAHIYLYVNPWGIIELNPLDFTDSRTIKLVLTVDNINGDGILKIYKTVGSTDYFITQRIAKIAIDINLTQSSVDFANILKTTAGAVAAIATGGTSTAVEAVLKTGASVLDVASESTPTLQNSVGTTTNSIRALDGNITLIYQNTYFAEEDNAEYGKPLCENTLLSTIPGFIKCGDGEIDIAGAMKQELEMISDFLINGFFYE